MPMITTKLVTTKKDLKTFVKFPFSLYKDSKYWVPPIISQEMETFNKDKNPIFNDAEATLILAYKGDQLVGRVAAIINWLEINNQNKEELLLDQLICKDLLQDYHQSNLI